MVGQHAVLYPEKPVFSPGDILEVLSPGLPPENLTVSAIFDEKGQSLDAARHPDAVAENSV